MKCVILYLVLLVSFFGSCQSNELTFRILLLDNKDRPVPNERIFLQPKTNPGPGEALIPKTIGTTNINGYCTLKSFYFSEFYFGTIKGKNSNKRTYYKIEKGFKKNEPIEKFLRFN